MRLLASFNALYKFLKDILLLNMVMNVCDVIHVLDQGVHIACGTPGEIRANPRVIEAYLGSEAMHEAGLDAGREARFDAGKEGAGNA